MVTGKWIQYDDDNPIPQREEDIVKLSGGGKGSDSLLVLLLFRNFCQGLLFVGSLHMRIDILAFDAYFLVYLLFKSTQVRNCDFDLYAGDWHMAYICMYKARVVPK